MLYKTEKKLEFCSNINIKISAKNRNYCPNQHFKARNFNYAKIDLKRFKILMQLSIFSQYLPVYF